MKTQNLKLALLQSSAADEALTQTLSSIDTLANQNVDLVCTIELFKSPYFCQDNNSQHFQLAESIPGPTTEALQKKAKEKSMVIVASVFEKDQDAYYNTAIVIDADGSFVGKYRKVHIPDDLANHYSEKFYFTPGNEFKTFKTQVGCIGVLICWDQWYPEAARVLAKQGADIIFYPTSIGWPRDEKRSDIGSSEHDAWITMQRSHAIANGVFVASCNRVGKENQIDFWGSSFVCDPMGRVLGQASQDQPECLIVECDLQKMAEVRQDWPLLETSQTISYSK